ncbi:23 kDa integral membrane protein isoform X2 [Gouania willdenowi]|uniref:23 kDa integral membrane protein isoform X2 n=1 Tax=Gouania willdenowi TaxID=441366 RepID=UPI001054F53E|nr:23 kDa integral membrane protein-like isoform X2 [Gouania willdenowi]
MNLKLELLKFCSTILNVAFMALGLSVSGCAVWILFGQSNFLRVISSEELRVVVFGLLLTGVVVITVSVLGCVGVNRESRFMLLVYAGFLIVLVLGQLFITLLLLINRGKGHCCGLTGPADWLENSFIQTLNMTNSTILPCSCFQWFRQSGDSPWCSEGRSLTPPLIGMGNQTFLQGCSQVLGDWLQENIVTVVAMDFSLVFIQLFQFIITVYLYQTFARKEASEKLTEPNDHDNLCHSTNEEEDYREQRYTHTVNPDWD